MSKSYVVTYRPGPAWVRGRPLADQPLAEHGRHVHAKFLASELVVAGPFTDDSGGIAVFRAASDEEARAFVESDPAVRAGVFVAELHPHFPVGWDEFGGGASPPFVATEVLPTLAATPATLAALFGRLSESRLASPPADGGWSPRDVVGHLLRGEETDWVPRIRIILAHGAARAFEPFVRDPQPTQESARDLLRRFTVLRRANLVAVRTMGLEESDLTRQGRHPELGIVTLRQLFAAWAAHDLGHIRQVCRVLAGGLREEVGPWQAYLPVVRESGGDSGAGAHAPPPS